MFENPAFGAKNYGNSKFNNREGKSNQSRVEQEKPNQLSYVSNHQNKYKPIESTSTKSSESQPKKTEEKKKPQESRYINIDIKEEIREISPNYEDIESAKSSSFHGILTSFISTHQEDEADNKTGEELVASNASPSKEGKIARAMRKFVTFESHESSKKIAVYSLAQIIVWVNLLATKVFLLIIPASIAIFASLGVVGTPVVGVFGVILLAVFLKKIIFAPSDLKDKFLHINKLQISDDQKMKLYKSALRWASIFLIINSLLFNVKSLRGQFVGESECPNDPHTFNTNGVVVVPDKIAKIIVGEPSSDSSLSAKWSRHVFSLLGLMRLFNFGMNILALASLVCTTLSILSLPTIGSLALPAVLQAIPFLGVFIAANPWVSVLVLAIVILCYGIGTYRTFRDNKLDRELNELKLMTSEYNSTEEANKNSIFLTQNWLTKHPGERKKQIELRKKVLGMIYFELTKQTIPNDRLEKLTPRELDKMIRYEYSKQTKLKEAMISSWSASKLIKETINLRKKEIEKSVKDFEYYKLEDLAKLYYDDDIIKANKLIGVLAQYQHNKEEMLNALQLNLKNIVPSYIASNLRNDKYNTEVTFEFAKNAILNNALSKTSENIKSEIGDTERFIEDIEEKLKKLKTDKKANKSEIKKAEKLAIREIAEAEKSCRKKLIEKITGNKEEYSIDDFSAKLKSLEIPDLQATYMQLANAHHDNEDDVIPRLILNRKVTPFVHRAAGWKEVRNFVYSALDQENKASMEHNTVQKLVDNLVSECAQIESGTLETTYQEARRVEMREQERLEREEKLKKSGNKKQEKQLSTLQRIASTIKSTLHI